MTPQKMLGPTTGPRPGRLPAMLAASIVLHGIFALLVIFDVAGIGSGFGLGIGPGYGIGAGGNAGLGEKKRREIDE
jgi:hypothetical protein